VTDPAIELLALGDFMIEHPLGHSPFYDLIQNTDISIANVEAPFTDQGYPADKTVAMKSPPPCVKELAKLGLNVAAVANNHAMDFGIDGMRQNKTLLAEAGVKPVGTGEDLNDAMMPIFVQNQALKVGFLSFSSTLPIGTSASHARPGMAPIRVETSYLLDSSICEEQPGTAPYVSTKVIDEELDRAVNVVKEAKQHCDTLVAALHWGVPEGWATPAQGWLADYQQPLAHALVDAGVDVIMGTHPHVIHGIEIYQGKPILYCLGNFTSHYFAKGRVVEIARAIGGFKFDPGGFDLSRYDTIPEHGRAFAARISLGKSKVQSVEILPYILDHQGEPQYASEANQTSILDRVERFSLQFGTTIERTDQGTGMIRI